MKSFVFGFAAMAVGASLLLAACGGDDDSSKTATPGAADNKTDSPTSTGGGASTSATTTGGASSDKSPGAGQLTGSGVDALKALARDISKKTFSASYDLESTGADGKTNKSTLVLSQKPPKSATSVVNGATTTFLIINDGTNSFTCTSTGASGGQCSKSKADSSSPLSGNLFSLDKTLQTLTENLNITEAGSRNIGGADSRCFTIKEASGTDGLACFTKSDGILTYVENKATGGTNTKLTASKISTSVDDSVFAPPAGYKVIDAPAR